MFLQGVLQQRLTAIQAEEQQLNQSSINQPALASDQFAATNFLRTSQRIGSIRNGQINYPREQRYYQGGPQDRISDKVQPIVDSVKDAIDKDLLGTKRPNWSHSNGIVGHPKTYDHHQTLKAIRTGLNDETIIKPKPNEVFVGTDTRDVYHCGWNVSTELINPRDSERFLQATVKPVMEKTKMQSEKLLMKSMQEKGLPYKTPEQLSDAIHQRVRQEKEDTTKLREELTQKIAYEMPRATQEAINGIVTRIIQTQLHDASRKDDPELTLKPDTAKTLRVQKEKHRHHNGKYQVNKFDDKGKLRWSCCQSKGEDAEGCIVKVVDKQRWTLTSFNE